MTAFAAVLWTQGIRPDPEICGHVTGTLDDLTGRAPCRRDVEGCTLWTAAFRGRPRPPLTAAGSCAVVGQVLIEDVDTLQHRLRVDGVDDLSLVAAAVSRWGERSGEQINGEYALVAYDVHERRLLAFRDGLGVRILYTASGPDGLIVTNVLGAACHPRLGCTGMDEAAIAAYLVDGGWIDDVRTAFHGVHVVPAGHTLVARPSGSVRVRRHWDFPAPPGLRLAPGELLDGYRDVLGAAVRDRTRNSRPAIFLSGGLDSATIAAAATERDIPLHAFSLTYARLAPNDDVRFARATARHLGLPHTVFAGDRHGALSSAHAPPLDLLDEPTLGDWRDAVRTVEADAQVALYGEDGDALFRPPGYLALRRACPPIALVRAGAEFILSTGRLPYLGLRLRERISRRPEPSPVWLGRDAAALAATARLSPRLPGHDPEAPHPTRPEARSRLATQISRHLALLLAPETTRSDLEIRLPLLDARVLRYVMSVPPIPWCQDKRLAREAWRSHLPEVVLDRPKTGAVGFNEALVAEWRDHLRGPVLDAAAALPAWVDRDALERTFRHGSWVDVMSAWRVVQLARWQQDVARQPREMAGV